MRNLLSFILPLFFLLSCGSPAAPAVTAVPLATTTPSLAAPPTPLPTDTPPPTSTPAPPRRFERALIVSFDGLRPDAILEAKMENVMALMRGGAYTFGAQTIMPSSTLPSHSSMLVGTCPSKHIVRWNQYVPDNGYAIGTDLFDLAHSVGMRTVMVVGKEKLRQVTEPSSTDFFAFVDDTDKLEDPFTIEQLAIQQMMKGFNLMFVHFPKGDLEGHDTTHGTDRFEDMTIPWIISGLGISNRLLTTPVHTTDTAATAAFALGLPLPPEWDGVPVFEAFNLPAAERDFPICQ
jgi:hypothetical protein